MHTIIRHVQNLLACTVTLGAAALAQAAPPVSISGPIEVLGNRFRKWATEAKCPTGLHGIRKGVSRRLAESGATDAQGRAITGHKRNKTFAHYAEKADRRITADAAMAKMIGEPDLANPEKT